MKAPLLPSGHPETPDAIRGAAAIVVAIAHVWQVFFVPIFGVNWVMTLVGGMATWAVAVFFLLSGILIGSSIKARAETGRFSLRGYAAARFFRIYPPLVLAVVVTVASVLIIQRLGLYGSESYLLPGDLYAARDNASLDRSHIIQTLMLTYNVVPGHAYLVFNGPLWSLSFEVWLYVLAGLLVSGLVNRAWLALAAGALVALQIFVVSDASHPPFWTVGLVWGIGFLFGWMGVAGRARLASHWIVGCIFCIAACLAIGGGDIPTFIAGPYQGLQQHLFYVAFSGAIFFIMLALLSVRWVERIAFFKGLVAAASFSYSLYLLHFPIFLFVSSLFRPFAVQFGLVGTVALAATGFAAAVWFSALTARFTENTSLLRGRLLALKS